MDQFGFLVEGLFSIVGNFSKIIVEVLSYKITIIGFPEMSILQLLSGALLGALIIFFIIKAIAS